MAIRIITGTILQPDQTPYTRPAVTFYLVDDFENGTITYPKQKIDITTDTAGYFAIDLAVPSTGTAHYIIYLASGLATDVYLASGPATDLATILAIPGIPDPQSAVQTVIDGLSDVAIKNKTADYTIQAGDNAIRCNGTLMITLPPATGSGVPYFVENVGTGVVTIVPSGTDTIMGLILYVLSQQFYSAGFLDAAAGAWDVLGGAESSVESSSFVIHSKNKMSDYAILAGDEVIRCNGTMTITLPTASGSGLVYFVKNIGTGIVTVVPSGTNKIDMANSYILDQQYYNAGFLDAAAGAWDVLGGIR